MGAPPRPDIHIVINTVFSGALTFMKYIYTLFFLLVFTVSYGQFRISGKVASLRDPFLAKATVRLYQDTTFKQAVLSGPDGLFSFEGLPGGRYRLVGSFTGYRSADTIINLTADCRVRFILQPQTVQLDSVSVTSRKNFMEKKADRIVYNIDGLSIYANKPVSDVLKSIPRLNVTRSAIEIRGSGPAAVMIAHRVIYLSGRDLLEYLNIYKDDIVSIEIITNPPAKYDAQGAGLINIVTKKKKNYGLFGYVESSVTKNTYWENDETLNAGFRNKNFSLVTSLGGSFGAYRETTVAGTSFFTPGKTDWTDNAANKNKYDNKRFNVVAEWLLSKRSKLYSSYSLTSLDSRNLQEHTLDYTSGGRLDSVGSSSGLATNKGVTHVVNLGLNSSFGKSNNNLDASFDYVHKTSNLLTQTSTVNYLADLVSPSGTIYDLFSSGDIPKSVFSTKVDLSFPRLFSGINLETGVKYTRFNNDSETDYDQEINHVSIYEGIVTMNMFHYREQDIAGYLSFNRDFKKWSTKAGLRYEETITDGYSPAERNRKQFGNFFPSAFLQYKIADGTSADLSYTRRIVRPSLFDVNPFKFYTSIYSDYVGNPGLDPSLQDNLNLNFMLKSNFLFSVFYNVTHSPVVSFPFNTDQNTIETRKINNGRLNSYGFNFDAGLNPKPWWQSSFSASLSSYRYNTDFNYDLNGTPVNITLSTRQSFQFSGSFSADLGFSATLPGGGYNISKQKGYSSLDLGLSRSLLKNRLILSLSGQDILRSSTQRSTILTPDFRAVNSNYYDFRQVMLSVRFKFGRELKVVRKKSPPQELNRLK
jgi:outer membrane receptor protein involved in Fe transport